MSEAKDPASRVALAHDYLLVMRGAERSFAAIAECWPSAPIYTLLHNQAATASSFAGHRVVVSRLQRLGADQSRFRRLLPLYPLAIRSLELEPADVVVSSSSAFAHGVRVPEGAAHVCYCYTPFRYIWHERARAESEVPAFARPAMRGLISGLRRWDLAASQGVTQYVAISELARERIAATYGRESRVVHPPVETERFYLAEPEDYFLIVTELVRHKNVAIALEAAERVGARVKVVGGGPELPILRRRFPKVEFLERVDDATLSDLYARALAYVMPAVEEFGIVAVEAQAAGRPVLATEAGGALETVIDGETGVLAPLDVDAFAEAMRETRWTEFDPERLQRHAAGFSRARFQSRFRALVEDVIDAAA